MKHKRKSISAESDLLHKPNGRRLDSGFDNLCKHILITVCRTHPGRTLSTGHFYKTFFTFHSQYKVASYICISITDKKIVSVFFLVGCDIFLSLIVRTTYSLTGFLWPRTLKSTSRTDLPLPIFTYRFLCLSLRRRCFQ